ncbi:hypothetical protein TESG_06395 [Trichophyton tonsurans CBS 112818]|uniref:Hydrophobin n=1 Tax=Trichophyton tonsurans (strain CBS 112818) TaxID=647933 RepID=F2S636_TRIT1|nr:hypothetical protein TESG_06395 [Trichophyton tonsurans CBS 112818]
MKVFYAAYLVSFYFYLSLVTASPVRPGSTTLSPVVEAQARAFNAPRARNVTSEAVPVPLSTGAAETGTEEQASSEATPTQASAAISEGQATPEISASATGTQAASAAQTATEIQPTTEPQPSSETPVTVTEMTSAAPEMTGTATENQAVPQMTAAATESQAAPGMTSAASGMASQSEASPTQAEASPQETMGSSPSPSPSPSISEEAPNSETHRVHKASPKQGNLCKTGDSYCCDEKDGKNTCIKSRTSCDQKVICCNNDNGYQFCMGDINFNMPITFNIDMDIDF